MEATFFKDYDQIPIEHRAAVNACVEHGLLEGKPTGEFAPNENITLGQLCKIVYMIANLKVECEDYKYENLGKLESCNWASNYISWCRKTEIYLKHGDFVSPDTLAVYSDISNMFSRAYHYITKPSNSRYSLRRRPSFDILDKKVTRSGLAYEIDILCQAIGEWCLDNQETLDFTSPELQRKVFFFSTFLPSSYSNYSHIFNVAFQIDPGFKFEDIPIQGANEILDYKENFFLSRKIEKDNMIYHFTGLSTLVSLATPSARFRMSNAAFLNDPSEGQIIMDNLPARLNRMRNKICPELKKWLKNVKAGTFKEIFNPNSTYIASFTASKDGSIRNLPMWNTYADFGRGCAIRFTSESFKCDLYRVQYSLKEAKVFGDSFIQKLNEVWSDWGNDNSPKTQILRTIALDTLAQCSYLFKDSSYRYENEVRAIFSCPPQQAEKEESLRDGELFPRTYCELPFHIEHVIFGPAVAEPERLAVGAASMGLDCTFEKSDIPFKNA